MSDTKLIVAIGILHLVALGAGGGLLFLAFRGGDGYDDPPHGKGGWGREPPPDPPRGPMGGPPLPSARPARVRLREPARLALECLRQLFVTVKGLLDCDSGSELLVDRTVNRSHSAASDLLLDKKSSL